MLGRKKKMTSKKYVFIGVVILIIILLIIFLTIDNTPFLYTYK